MLISSSVNWIINKLTNQRVHQLLTLNKKTFLNMSEKGFLCFYIT